MTTGFGGTVILGPAGQAGLGRSVTAIGDVNGDGRADFAVSAPAADNGYSGAGTAQVGLTYVFYGGNGDLAAQIDLAFSGGAQPDGTVFSVIQGNVEGGVLGGVLAPAGDINNDGISDLIIGSSSYGTLGAAPVAIIIYGQMGGLGAILDVINLGAETGTRLTVDPDSGPFPGFGAEGLGDLNGDGFGDLLITNPVANECFILFGDGAAHPAALNMNANFETQKDTYTNVTGGFSAGDLNDDGLDDLVLLTAGGAAVLFGSTAMGGTTKDMENATLTGATGLSLGLEQIIRVEPLADINGDGIADLLIEGRANAQTAKTETYVLFGKSGGFGASVDLTLLTGADGFSMSQTLIGSGFGGIGDINGDGFRDFIVADAGFDPSTAPDQGAVYIVFGRAQWNAATFDLAAMDSTSGYRITGLSTQDRAGGGQIVDVNGDGFGDVIFGVPGMNGGAGGVGIVYGGPQRLAALDAVDGQSDGHLDFALLGTVLNFTEVDPVPIGGGGGTGGNAPTQMNDDLIGTSGVDVVDLLAGDDTYASLSGDDNVQGNLGNDQIFGDGGHDTLLGDVGNDTLFGGSGDDLLDGGADADQMAGGLGNDVFICNLAGDRVEELDQGGIDRIQASVSYVLGASLENLTLIGVGDLRGTGNFLANRLNGNVGANLLRGMAGNDILLGGAGADTLCGGAGRDWMGAGDDAQRDVFVFGSVLDSVVGLNRDVIDGFQRFEDQIDLRQMDANRQLAGNQAFHFNMSNPRAHAVWWVDTGNDIRLRGDVNGDRIFDFEIRVTDLARFAAADILL